MNSSPVLLLALLLGVSWPARLNADSAVRTFSGVAGIEAIRLDSQFFGYQSAIDRDYTDGQPAYDYSVHLIKTGEDTGQRLRMFSGGRWRISALGPYFDGDHVLQHSSPYGAPGTWSMFRYEPDIWKGQEEGFHNVWYARNVLEPEVVGVNGQGWFMFTQVEIDPGDPIDLPGQYATVQADRIQLHTSTDCSHWTRWPDRGVIINLDQPAATMLHHQEVVYVPWDETGRPWWMYVAWNLNQVFRGYVRLRSASPYTFDWQQREPAGLAQLGNQIGYLQQAPGGPLFVRITFVLNAVNRTVPSLQFSRDGLNWFFGNEGPVELAGSQDNARNRNCYFLGIATVNGTGQIEYLGNQTYRATYGATTCNSPIAPDIFDAEIGIGEVVFTLEPSLIDWEDLAALAANWLRWGHGLKADLHPDLHVDLLDVAVLAAQWLQPTPADWPLP